MFINLFFDIEEEEEEEQPCAAGGTNPTPRQKHLVGGGLAAALDPVSVLLILSVFAPFGP